MKRIGLSLVLLAACGGPRTESPPPPAPAAVARAPLELPRYPGAMLAGVIGGTDLTDMMIATDPISMVRGFYTKDHLTGFEILGGDATKESPLRLRDVAGHREYAIAIYEENKVTMIAATIHVVP